MPGKNARDAVGKLKRVMEKAAEIGLQINWKKSKIFRKEHTKAVRKFVKNLKIWKVISDQQLCAVYFGK